jgi:hypothetical protein
MKERVLVDFASFGYFLLGLQNNDVAHAVLSRENHALRLDTHHCAVLQVEDKRAFLAHEVFGLVPLQETRDRCAFFGAEVHGHFDEVSGTCDVVGFRDFSDAQVEFLEFAVGNVRAFCAHAFTKWFVSWGLFLSFPRSLRHRDCFSVAKNAITSSILGCDMFNAVSIAALGLERTEF